MTEGAIYKSIPSVALRAMVMFPKMRLDFEPGRDFTAAAVDAAMQSDHKIFLVTQRDDSVEVPAAADLYRIGVLAEIKQLVHIPGAKYPRVVVEGICRAAILSPAKSEGYLSFDCLRVETKKIKPTDADYAKSAVRAVKDFLEEYLSTADKKVPPAVSDLFFNSDPDSLADSISMNVPPDYQDRQMLLEELGPIARLEKLCTVLSRETELANMKNIFEEKTQFHMEQSERNYFLHEQLRLISQELGEGEDAGYREKIAALALDEDIKEKLFRECEKLSKLQSTAPEANVIQNYLDECLLVPWGKYTEDSFDLEKARKVLDSEHFGLDKIKDRFIEMLAVRALTNNAHGQIICLVGPPGVGKTSVVRSVAKAMGRKYVRMSLGGVKDESEIRGHRKTYIGAMPGRIIKALEQAKSMNPIILLDEIDKLSNDYHGDPSSALLEALDPEQNNTFLDRYIEFPTDLSRVLFITTANSAESIPAPLLDRMEIIELTSYTLEEKLAIAKEHLVKKQRIRHGLDGRTIRFSDAALRFLIDGYTREAGVRKLEQLIGAVCRKSAVKIAGGEAKSVSVTKEAVEQMLGPVKFKPDGIEKEGRCGVVNGLAWTSVGGEMLQVEAVTMDGSGKLELTGSLGDVMKESAKAAHSFIRSRASSLGIDSELFKNKDIHVHVPQGAVPKDGPSAGVTIATALLSALTGRTVRADAAMTGEISLTGRVMPIGGLKEKSMAAFKNGIGTVFIPKENESDLWEVDEKIKKSLDFVPVSQLDEIFSGIFLSSSQGRSKHARVKFETKNAVNAVGDAQ